MLVVLSLARSRDNQYLLPLLPPLAMLAGLFVEHTWQGLPIHRVARPALWLFGVAVCAAVSSLPLLPWLMSGAFTVSGLVISVATAFVGVFVMVALARGNARGFWTRMAGLAILAGVFFGLYAEPELNREKSGKPLVAALERLVPRDADFCGCNLNENTEGMLVFYGWRPRHITSLREVTRLGSVKHPLYMMFMSREEHHEPAESLIMTNDWQLVERVEAGGRFYWILANRAAFIRR